MNFRQCLVLVPVLGFLALWIYGWRLLDRETQNDSCQSNLKQIGYGLKIYERDYDEKTVLANNWKTALWPYRNVGKLEIPRDEIFDCPSGYNYAFNRYLSGANHSQIADHAETPTIFDSNSSHPNTADFGDSYLSSGAHLRLKGALGSNTLFFDGDVHWRREKPKFLPLMPPKPKKLFPNKTISPLIPKRKMAPAR